MTGSVMKTVFPMEKYNLPFDLEEIGFGAHNRRKKRWSIMTAIIEFKPPGHAWRRRLPVK
jgi:hypothetical protein